MQHTIQQESARAANAERRLDEERARSRRFGLNVRVGIALILMILGLLAIAFGPELFKWDVASEHEHRSQISILGSAAWLGMCWLIVKPKTWQPILIGVVLAAVFALVTLL